MDLELAIFQWVCGKSGQTFEALDWSGDWGAPYGETLMYAQSGDAFYWKTIGDKAFDKCDEIVSHHFGNNTRNEQAFVIKSICGIACDLGPDQSILKTEPYCPFCTNCQVRQIKVLEIKQYSIPEVTHIAWNSWSEQEKEKKILTELIRQKFIKPV